MIHRSKLVIAALGTVLLAAATPLQAAEVLPGWDLFETTQPTDFLGIPFEGVPLGTFDFGTGPTSVGFTDTIVRRIDPADVPSPPGTAPPIQIEIVALQLRSVVPVNLGCGNDFHYVTLSAPPSTGTMQITFDDPLGGTFDSELTINFDMRVGGLAGPVCFPGVLPLTSSAVPWDREALPGALLIPFVNHKLNGADNGSDIHPEIFTEVHPEGEGRHTVQPPPLIPCEDTAPICDGACPDELRCQFDEPTQTCFCAPPPPCEQSFPPVCNGTCPPGEACEPDATGGACECAPAVPAGNRGALVGLFAVLLAALATGLALGARRWSGARPSP